MQNELAALATAIERNPDLAEVLSGLAARLRDAESQRDARPAPLDADQNEARGPKRTVVRITRHGSALLDVDNLHGGVKALLDACRYEGLIKNDDSKTIELQVFQKKVPRVSKGTLIEIEYA